MLREKAALYSEVPAPMQPALAFPFDFVANIV
jgi:hypothetical protein